MNQSLNQPFDTHYLHHNSQPNQRKPKTTKLARDHRTQKRIELLRNVQAKHAASDVTTLVETLLGVRIILLALEEGDVLRHTS